MELLIPPSIGKIGRTLPLLLVLIGATFIFVTIGLSEAAELTTSREPQLPLSFPIDKRNIEERYGYGCTFRNICKDLASIDCGLSHLFTKRAAGNGVSFCSRRGLIGFSCGDGVCEGSEDENSCFDDCGFAYGIEYARPIADFPVIAGQTGADWIKIAGVSWNLTQPKEDGAYNWTLLDRVVSEYQKNGLTIGLAVLKSDADWAVEKPPYETDYSPSSPPKEGYWGYYADWVGAVVERYDNDSKDDMPNLISPIHSYEIESEVYHDGYWQVPEGENRSAKYAQLLETAYIAAHAADPNANIFLAGLNIGDLFDDGFGFDAENFPSDQEIIDRLRDSEVLAELFNSQKDFLKLDEYFDMVEFHYNHNYLGGYGTINWIKSKMVENGYSKPIWAGDALIASGIDLGPLNLNNPMPNLPEDALLDVLNKKNDKNYVRMWKWHMAETSANLMKKVVVGMDNDVKGLMAGNLMDWPVYGNDIRWQGSFLYAGFYGIEINNGPGAGAVPGKRPIFYNYPIIRDKIEDVKSIEKLDLSEEAADYTIFVYKITKSDDSEVYVAWYEDPVAKAALTQVTTVSRFLNIVENKKTKIINLRDYVSSENVKTSHIVTKLDILNNLTPIYPPDEVVSANSIRLSETPIFIEESRRKTD